MDHRAIVSAQSRGAGSSVGQAISDVPSDRAIAASVPDAALGAQPSSAAGAPTASGVSRTGGSQRGAAAGETANANTGPRGPLSLGVVGTLSGPVGAVYAGTPVALRVWSRAVNDRGGIAGHQVNLTFVDDGGDPARYASALQDLVENRHVLAFVGNPAPVTNMAGRAYLEAKRAPVVGGDLGSNVWIQSPMHFPQGTTADEQLFGVLATGARISGKVNFGTMACQELQVCRDADRLWNGEHARRLHLHPVSRALVALAQPDFTAECLSAKQAGAELLAMAIDINSAYRIGASCARVNYHPAMAVPYSAVASREATDKNLDGLMAATPTFPYLVRDTAAAQEFAQAMARYAPGAELSGSASVGWTAGKLFEKVAATMGDNPTRPRLLDALWALHAETLGGLTQPLTYVKDQPAPRTPCWFVMRITDGKWTAPKGSTPACP